MKFYLSTGSELIIMEGTGHAYVAKTLDVLAELLNLHGFVTKDYLDDALVYFKNEDFFIFHERRLMADMNESNLNLFAEKSKDYADAIAQSIIRHAI
jgi:hypothetical protein